VKHRVGLIHPKGSMDTLPCLTSAVVQLAQSGYGVDVFLVPEERCILPNFGALDVRIVTLGSTSQSAPKKVRNYNLISFVPSIIGIYRQESPVALIGVDPFGLMMASLAAGFLRCPVIYYSLEVMVSSEIRKLRQRVVKFAERFFSRRAAFSIIQDTDRAALLSAENGIPLSQIVCVPNSPLRKAELLRTHYLRDKLGIPAGKRIALCAGNLASYTQSLELARSAHTWPEEWALVLHNRQKFEDDAYGQAIMQLADRRHVFLSTEQVPFDFLPDLIASADIGVALYYAPFDSPDRGANIIHMGLSSGKLATYLQVGLPVIVSDLPTLRFIENYGCGLLVSNAEAVVPAIRRVLGDYDTFAANAIRCYQELYDFASKFNEVLRRLETLTAKK